MTPLCKLSRKHGCDKGGEYHPYGDKNRWSHSYTPVYWKRFKDLRDEPLTLLEIGVSEGYSLNMWHEFFPRARIVGWDVRDDRWTEVVRDPLVRVQKVDQGDMVQMVEALHVLGNPRFEIIIDDGSHQFKDQMTSWSTLLPTLKPDGLYIIEDMTTELPVPVGWKNKVYRWPLRKNQDPAMGDMLQVIRRD